MVSNQSDAGLRDSVSNLNSVHGPGTSVAVTNQGKVVQQESNDLSKECISGFPDNENKDDIVCLILIKSGTLILQGCSLSVESIKDNSTKMKVPCIYHTPDTTSFIQRCSFRGGGLTNALTAGIYSKEGNSVIQNCQFH